MIDKNSKIYISGHKGMVGSVMLRLLESRGYKNLIFKTSKELDLRIQKEVDEFIEKEYPEYIFHFAAKVGGIKANINYPAEFLYDNIMIATNVINAAYKYKVKKLLYLGSSCIYPRECLQPMKEEYLLTGKLEPTNEGYALAKIIGLKLCKYYNKQYKTNFISLMPPNIYGPNDNFDLETSHVVAALIRKFIEAKENSLDYVTVLGTGEARREFLYVEDLADACLYFIENYEAKDLPEFINVGYGKDITIKELVRIIGEEVGYKGEVIWDSSFPDGMSQKLLDSSISKKLGWKPKIPLREGLRKTIKWYKNAYISKAKRV